MHGAGQNAPTHGRRMRSRCSLIPYGETYLLCKTKEKIKTVSLTCPGLKPNHRFRVYYQRRAGSNRREASSAVCQYTKPEGLYYEYMEVDE